MSTLLAISESYCFRLKCLTPAVMYICHLPRSIYMRILPFLATLLISSTCLSGCLEDAIDDAIDDAAGPDSYVDEIHVWQDGWTSDSTICETSVVLTGGEWYVCSFELNEDNYFVIDLDVQSSTDRVDLITMDDINYEKWENDEDFYYYEDWTDFGTYGGQYGKNVEAPAGQWFVVVFNQIG